MDGGPCGKGAVLLRLLGRKSLASSTLAPSASRSAVIGHGIGPGIQSAKTGWIGMAERSRAYVSDAFARIPPWCNGSTRVFGTFGPGSNPGGGAWRQHVELIYPSTFFSESAPSFRVEVNRVPCLVSASWPVLVLHVPFECFKVGSAGGAAIVASTPEVPAP